MSTAAFGESDGTICYECGDDDGPYDGLCLDCLELTFGEWPPIDVIGGVVRREDSSN